MMSVWWTMWNIPGNFSPPSRRSRKSGAAWSRRTACKTPNCWISWRAAAAFICWLGLSPATRQPLQGIRKSFNKTLDYHHLIRSLQQRGITVQGCFVFGFDHDDASVFESTVQLVQDLGRGYSALLALHALSRHAVVHADAGGESHPELQLE